LINVLNPLFEARINTFIYKFRFLGLYIAIGFISLLLEFFLRPYFIKMGFNHFFSTLISILLGILFAFWANVKYNFNIPPSGRNRALKLFVIISIFSGFVQLILKKILTIDYLTYEQSRLLISSIFFLIGYGLHRKYSFRDFKKVGVAVYANGVENISRIHKMIGHYPDFIHVDIIDKTMSEKAEDVKTYRLETMKAFWPSLQVQTHIMSRKPSKWLNDILLDSDVVFVHVESDEDVIYLLNKIKQNGKKAGLALTMSTKINDVLKFIKIADYVLLLTIQKPGSSGQSFDMNGWEKIKEINDLSFRKQFVLCVDGGMNENLVSSIEAECIVSGSSVFNSLDPKKQIMRLQTVGRYHVSE